MNGNQVIDRNYDYAAARRLWQAVLLEQWRVVFRPLASDGPNDRRQAIRFFQSRDLHAVCALAGLDSVAVFERWLDRMSEIEQGGE